MVATGCPVSIGRQRLSNVGLRPFPLGRYPGFEVWVSPLSVFEMIPYADRACAEFETEALEAVLARYP